MASQSLSIWTNELTLEFLDLYKSENAIWDPSHPQHKSRHDIILAWRRIKNAMSLNISITDLKKKKEALMATFRLNCHKKKRNPSFVSPWFAWPVMESFLGSLYESESTQLEHQFFTADNYDGYEKLDDDPISVQKSEDMPVFKQARYKVPAPQTFPLQSAIKANSNNECNSTKNKRKSIINEEIDECDLYTELLARKLKRLDEHQRDIAMHDIDMIMFRAKMNNGIKYRKEHNYSESASSPPRKMKSPIFIVNSQDDTYDEDALTYQEVPVESQQSP